MSSDSGEWNRVVTGGKTVRIEEFPHLPTHDETTDAPKDSLLKGLGKSWGSDSEEEEAAPPGAAESEEANVKELEALAKAQKLRSKAKQVKLRLEKAKAKADELRKKFKEAEAEADKLREELQKTEFEYRECVKVLYNAHSDASKPIQAWTVGNTTIAGDVPTSQGLSGGTATGSVNVQTNSTACPQDGAATQRLSPSRNPGWFWKDGTLRPLERDCHHGQDCYNWKNGECPFNHGCEKCPNGRYCKSTCCPYDHPVGRAAFVFKNREG